MIKLVTSSGCGRWTRSTCAATSLPVCGGLGWMRTISKIVPSMILSRHNVRMLCSHMANCDVKSRLRGCQQMREGGSCWSTNHVMTEVEALSPSQLNTVLVHSSCKSWITSGIASRATTPGTILALWGPKRSHQENRWVALLSLG